MAVVPLEENGGTPGSLEGVAGFPYRSLPYILFDFYAHIFTLQNIKNARVCEAYTLLRRTLAEIVQQGGSRSGL